METLELTYRHKQSIGMYRRMGIDIEIDGDKVIVRQSRLLNGYILNQKQLVERAREIFDYGDWKIVPVVYSLDVNEIDIPWIEAKMEEFGIKRNDIIKQLALDKSTLSSLFSGDRGLTKGVKAAFYFYFLTYQLNRDFREQINGN